MKRFIGVCVCLCALFTLLTAQEQVKKEESSSNLRQYYSGKVGFYQPSDCLNNGLLFGVDGITEFIHYNFFLSGAVDLYLKQTISIFRNPQPSIDQQQMILLPLHVNFGWKMVEIPDADSRLYVGAGVGYYLYFYNVQYNDNSGGGGLLGGSSLIGSQSESRSGGNIFGSVFARVLIGKVFVEPRYYFAKKKVESVTGNYSYVVNPSGFAITLGIQYH